jgi:protoporphyrinogen/coproporphyrinogen III oxidase
MADEMRGSLYAFTGATLLFAFFRDLWRLIAELGLSERLVAVPAMGRGMADNGAQQYPLDFNRTFGMLGQRALSWKSRLRLALLIPDFMQARRRVDPCLLHTAADMDDASLSEYLSRKVGTDFLEHIVGPVYRTLWAWNPESMSRAYFLSVYAHIRGRPSFRIRGGLGVVTRELAGRLTVRYNTRVSAIRRSGSNLQRVLEFTTPQGDATMCADLVVCAVDGASVRNIVKDMAPYEMDFFAGGIPSAQFSMIIYVFKALPAANAIRMFYTRKQRNPVCFLFAHPGTDVAGDPPRIWALVAPDRAPHYFGLNGQEFEPVVREFVREKYPFQDHEILEAHVMQQGYTIAAFPPGQLRRVRSFLTSQEAGPKNIYYAGDYLSNATTGGACASGERVARQIVADWGDSIQ